METGLISRIRDATRASSGEMLLLALLAAVVVGGSALVYLRTSDPPGPPVKHVKARQSSLEQRNVSTRSEEKLVVHVAGLVARPGVYELPKGSRVRDAITAAGGPAAGADVDALNLAELIADGQKIVVPKLGEPAPAAGSGEVASTSSKVDLNRATKEQLEALPSVGPVLAQRIIDFRTKRGGFKSVRQLMEVEGFGPKKFESLKDLVTV